MMIKNRKDLVSLLEKDYIDINSFTDEELFESFKYLNENMMTIYNFMLIYNEYFNRRQDYYDNEQLTSLEAHLLTDICDIENSTATSLALAWNRSKSATSQTIRKLIEKDLITRKNSEEDAKVFYLVPTEKGKLYSDNHKRYDVIDIIKTIKSLRKTVSLEDMETMLKVLDAYLEVLK